MVIYIIGILKTFKLKLSKLDKMYDYLKYPNLIKSKS